MRAPRSSTATLGREDSHVRSQGSAAGGSNPEAVPEGLLDDGFPRNLGRRLIIAVDFGTTYSAVSYVTLEEGESAQYIDSRRIRSIQNYPDDQNFGYTGDMRCEVPTEVMYPLERRHMREFRRRECMKNAGRTHDSEPEEQNEEYEDSDTVDDEAEPDMPGVDVHMVEEANMDVDMLDDSEGLAIFGPQDDSEGADDNQQSFKWGYSVHEARGLVATHADPTNQVLARFKLLLDNSPLTNAIRARLEPTLRELKAKKIIKDSHHVIVDFLTCLLRHTRSQLKEAGINDEEYHTEMVLCVPAIWTQKACRDMQTALAKAMYLAGFGGVDVENNCIENLFIVSEPEAAAAYVLAKDRRITPGDRFVLLDAGGGTVDANTYAVTTVTPLRLAREEVDPGGGLYGSSYLNEGFCELLHRLLDDETYLERKIIDGNIERIVISEFEYRLKRTFDCYGAKGAKKFDIPGLHANWEKGFRDGQVVIHVKEIQEIFLERLKGIAAVMEEQLNAALEKGVTVHHVILIGGFAASISLQKYLHRRLSDFCKRHSLDPIELTLPENNTATAVASGAVLRACNKEGGPRRRARSSYGILRTEPFGEFPEHKGLKAERDRHDGLRYIRRTVDWVLKLGDEVPAVWTCEPFVCSHTFDCSAKRLICREVLYVSDSATESHYPLSHPKNKGVAEKVGEIVVDFTYLRDRGLIQPINGGIDDQGNRVGKRHYRVTYTMVIRVVDRDLQCYAIYDGQIKQKCKLNIAPAFRPGVK